MTRREEQAEWDDLTPPTQEELKEAQALREALEGQGEHPDADFGRSLLLAYDPPEIDPQLNEWLVKRAVHRASPRGRSRSVAVLAGVGVSLALAAGVALVFSDGLDSRMQSAAMVEASLIPSRSTQALFDEPFERHGGTSSRVDRIAQERSRDYRSNLFARMGVRE